MSHNFLGIRKLRSYTCRANHIANLLFSWRPFLDALWAACSVGGINGKAVTARDKNRNKNKQKTRAVKRDHLDEPSVEQLSVDTSISC